MARVFQFFKTSSTEVTEAAEVIKHDLSPGLASLKRSCGLGTPRPASDDDQNDRHLSTRVSTRVSHTTSPEFWEIESHQWIVVRLGYKYLTLISTYFLYLRKLNFKVDLHGFFTSETSEKMEQIYLNFNFSPTLENLGRLGLDLSVNVKKVNLFTKYYLCTILENKTF